MTAHRLVLGLFADRSRAVPAAEALHGLGVPPADISVVARDHREEGVLAAELGATPGAELEDSRTAARLGEVGAYVIAAVSVILPGVGPVLAAGPLAAEFGEVIGHAAGGVAAMLADLGLDEERARRWQDVIERGGVLLAVHATAVPAERVEAALAGAGPDDQATAGWV